MTAGVMKRTMRMILPFRLVIEGGESTFKPGQNKTAAQRAGRPDAGLARHPAGWAFMPI
jgi:hypothetical protein